jgi:endonuclease YncB( thermonuclease family)
MPVALLFSLLARVACIDCPRDGAGPYGQQAREALLALLPDGSTVVAQDAIKVLICGT